MVVVELGLGWGFEGVGGWDGELLQCKQSLDFKTHDHFKERINEPVGF